MGLEKAIEHSKEKRKPFGREHGNYAKAVDMHCRNHGGRKGRSRNPWECEYCLNNRTHKNRRRDKSELEVDYYVDNKRIKRIK